MITLVAESTEWKNTSQYVAHITGRDPKFTFRREFTGQKNGSKTIAYIDEVGMYEVCHIDNKGRKNIKFAVIVPRPADCPPLTDGADPELMRFWATDSDAAIIARRLDAGENLAEMIEPFREEGKDSYGYRLRSKGEAKRASAAATIDSAVEQCWQVLQAFPEREAKKVLATLKARISPKTTGVSAETVSAEEANHND